ncbi:DUF3306 domain-containing protein [Pseudoroseomonas cervicalis]|uniref:DUF3306 domain-containing protein n=1 Tax=Teichococcus cervicalis TaxID=204525 RepID=UPI0022F16D6C|nr:DUF3306 domain-containing protein [Pseudoroseomonas cervicalis]WBV43383.1 DUF3306 domain-containing protein [Pseudoroseomonas cervicalis]
MSGEGFLSRWSRRKRGVEPEAPEPAAPARVLAAPEAVTPAAATPAEAPDFDLASLPSLESLTAQSDFTAFLRPQVPWALRQAALRRMWSLDIGIRDFVGPADYAWDFNAPDGVPGFALELGGDVKRLLAQAIGAPDPEEKPAPDGEGEAVAQAGPDTPPGDAAADGTSAREARPGDAAEPASGLAAAEEGGAAPQAAPPSPLRLSGTALPLPSPPVLPAGPGLPVAASEPPAAEAPLRRRHGGALPS